MTERRGTGKKRIRLRGNGYTTRSDAVYSLKQAFDMFFHAKSGEGLRQRTLDDYRRHFQYFSEWMDEYHPQVVYVGDIGTPVLRQYVYYMSHEKPLYRGHPRKSEADKSRLGLAAGAVNVRLTTLKAMFRWWTQEGIIATNPAQNLKKLRVDEDVIGAFTDEQLDLLFAQPDQRTYAGFRDFVLMRLLLETGMRIGEVLSITLEDVDFKTRLITLAGQRNKNRRTRVVPFSTEMARLVMELVADNKTYFPDTDRIFVSSYGESLTLYAVGSRIKVYGIKAGIADKVRCSPHTFRHTMAKQFLTSGGDIVALQRILGHSSMAMVRKYVQHRPEDLLEAHDRFSRYQSMVKSRRRF